MIYLDNAATSFPKPPGLAEAVADHITRFGVSSGRGSYGADVKASRIAFNCREKLAAIFNISDSSRIAFTLNATAGINTILKGYLRSNSKIITTSMEHNAVMRPLNHLIKERGVSVVKAGASPEEGYLDLEDFRKKLPGSDLAVINHASNVSGAIQNLSEIGILCRDAGVPLMVDAAQTAGIYPVDTEKMNISFLAFSGHKGLMGPTGCGAFYAASDMKIDPLIHGGTGSNSEEESQPEFWPDAMESGTLNLVPLSGLNHALDFILSEGIESISEKISSLTGHLIQAIEDLPRVRLKGPKPDKPRTSSVSVTIEGVRPSEAAAAFNREDICVRTGLHCAPGAHKHLGSFPEGSIRISPGYFSTDHDIDQALRVLKEL